MKRDTTSGQLLKIVLGSWEAKALKMSKRMFNPNTGNTLSGFTDSHIHICRAYTHKPQFLPPGMSMEEVAHLPLRVKQGLLTDLHNSPAYSPQSLRARMNRILETKVLLNEKVVYGVVDTTPDIRMRALEILENLREDFSDRLEIKIGSYCVFGFSKFPESLDVFQEASKRADFIVGLPEKDDLEPVDRESFESHVSRLLEIGFHGKKEIHIHVDQQNSAFQEDCFRIISVIKALTPEKRAWFVQGEPKVFLIHLISPSCYGAEKFFRLVGEMKEYNVGLIVCPSAAISMRNLRSENGPLHNSVARFVEMILNGVTVRIGTDNVNDIFVPSGNGSVLREICVLSNITRCYDIQTLVKLGMNMMMHPVDLERLHRGIEEDQRNYKKHAQIIARIQRETKPDLDY